MRLNNKFDLDNFEELKLKSIMELIVRVPKEVLKLVEGRLSNEESGIADKLMLFDCLKMSMKRLSDAKSESGEDDNGNSEF